MDSLLGFMIIFYTSFCAFDLSESIPNHIIKPVVFLFPIMFFSTLEDPMWQELALIALMLIALIWVVGLLLHYKIIKE